MKIYIQSIRFSTSKKTVIFLFRFMLFMDNLTWYLSSLSSYIYVHLFLMIVPSDHNYWIDIHVIFGHWLFRSFIGHLPLNLCCHWLKMTPFSFSSLMSNVKCWNAVLKTIFCPICKVIFKFSCFIDSEQYQEDIW